MVSPAEAIPKVMARVAERAPWQTQHAREREEPPMKMTIDMPNVANCNVNDCCYNNNNKCHARAITVGDGNTPACDTYFNCGAHSHSQNNAGVGACKVSKCSFNHDFECNAQAIEVGSDNSIIRCKTFRSR